MLPSTTKGTSCRSVKFGLRRSGLSGPKYRRFLRKSNLFAKLPHGHPPWKGLQGTFLPSSVYGGPKSGVRTPVPSLWRTERASRCGCLAGAYSIFHGIMQVSRIIRSSFVIPGVTGNLLLIIFDYKEFINLKPQIITVNKASL